MRFEKVQLAGGWRGTNQTVAKMERFVEASLSDPVVRLKAEEIVRGQQERDRGGEHRAISDFVRTHMKYLNEAVETIKTPRWLVDEINLHGFAQGDCDDFCVLWAALHRVIGHDVRFKVASQRRDKVANHIYGQVLIPGRGWVTDDCIKKDKAMSWEMPQESVTASKLYAVGSAFAGLAGLEDGDDGGGATHSGSAVLTNGPRAAYGSVTSGLRTSGLGQYELIAVAVSAAATAATIAAQAQAQNKAIKVQKKAMEESARQFDASMKQTQDQAAQQQQLAMAQIAAQNVGSGLHAGSSSLPDWAIPAGLVAAAGIAAYFILRGK